MSEKIYGVVTKVIYFKPETSYGIISLKLNFKDKEMAKYEDYLYSNSLTVTTVFDRKPLKDEKYTFIGEFVESKYGIQFKANSFRRSKPNTLESVVMYLSSDLFEGVGKVAASNIYHTLGSNCLELIRENKEVLDKVEGLSDKQKEAIYNGIISNLSKEEMVLDLTEMGISLSLTTRIINALHDRSVDIVRKNPYDLIDMVEGIGFTKADHIAKLVGIPFNSPIRLKAITIYYLKLYTFETGDSFVEKEKLKSIVLGVLNKEKEVISEIEYEKILEEMIFDGKLFVDEDNNVYDINIYNGENIVASRVVELLNRESESNNNIERIINDLEEEYGINYNEKQKEAIRCALNENIMIITGGPGTGKSTVIKGIVDGYVRLKKKDLAYEDIVLLAPTGRASKRMAEVTKRNAQTIHRYLGYTGNGRFTHGPDNLVEGKLIIIDEMSMVDINLCAKLFSALHSDVKIIMVGDSDQLPSVAPGEVLCNLIETKEITTVKLDKIHRQAESSTIVSLAHNINRGLIPENLLERQKDRNFIKMNDNIIMDNIIEIVRQGLNRGMNLLKDIQVLVPMYKGLLGIDAINDKMQEVFNPLVDFEIKNYNKKFRVNDKVIQLVNRSDKGVMNGDIGQVISLDIEKELVKGMTVMFDFGPVDYEKDELDDLTLAYAISIHKSQGSEFKTVIIPFSTKYYVMLKRKLVYTAITRAKEYLVMLGNPEAMQICTNRLELPRKTKLVSKIKNQFNPSTLSPYDFM